MTIWVVMAAYNEGPRLPALLSRWVEVLAELGHPHRYVVVDDGSTDETPHIVSEFSRAHPLHVITHGTTQGLGVALRHALRFVVEHGDDEDVLVTMDADNTHPPELLSRMLLRMAESDCDVVIASRFCPGARTEGVSRFRRLCSLGAGVLFQMFFPIPNVRDYTCGFRLYSLGVVNRAFDQLKSRFCERPGFDCNADILLRLVQLGAAVREVPLHLQYARKAADSKMPVSRTIKSTLSLMFKRRLGR